MTRVVVLNIRLTSDNRWASGRGILYATGYSLRQVSRQFLLTDPALLRWELLESSGSVSESVTTQGVVADIQNQVDRNRNRLLKLGELGAAPAIPGYATQDRATVRREYWISPYEAAVLPA